MSKRPLVQIVAAIIVTVFAAGLWLTGDDFDPQWLRLFSLAVWIAVFALLLWEKWLWRLSLIQETKKAPRDIRGTWRGTLRSLWVDPDSGQSPEEKTVYLIIRQDAFNVSTVLLTDESRSVSTVAVVTDDQTVTSLDYMYLNRPDSRVEDRSRMHHGSASLDIIGQPVTRLRGRYWTDRNSRGELEFTERRLKQVEGYTEAADLFAES